MERIVFACSGEPDGALPHAPGAGVELIAVVMDVGQGRELSAVRQRALALGAMRAHVLDVREEFAREYVLPALQAGAMDGGTRPMIASLARPLIVRKLIEIAEIERTSVIAYAARECADGSDPMMTLARALAPDVRTVCTPDSHDEGAFIVSTLWGRSVRLPAGRRGNERASTDLFTITRDPEECAAEPAIVTVSFEAGVPVGVNGIEMPLVELIESLETIAGAHGVGRGGDDAASDDRADVCEAPAAVVLCRAHEALERRVLAGEVLHRKDELGRAYAALVESGRWFTTMRDSIDAFVATTQVHVTGAVTLSLLKGECQVTGVTPDAGCRETTLDAGHAPFALGQ